MARVSSTDWSSTLYQEWMVDYDERRTNLPGGVHLDPAAFTANAAGVKMVPAGTVIGRTNAERDADTGFGPAADADDEVFIMVNTVQDAAINPDAEVMRRGAGIKVNLFPGWGSLSSAIQGKLAAKYELTRGRG